MATLILHEGENVGDYFADINVEEKIIVELKSVDTLIEDHEQQLVNYLKATTYEVGLLLNFGTKPQVKKRVFTNDYKNNLRV